MRFIRLHPDDNVLTVASAIGAGQAYEVEGATLIATQAIAVGFKVAACPIASGAKVIKYGAVIGSASQVINTGDVVHTHNLKSDYLPTYARGEGEARTP